MKWMLIVGLLLAGLQASTGPSSDQQIHESLRALPESLRDGAKVVGYNESGERVTLKDGKVTDRRKILIAEIEAGKIPMPDLAVRYTLRGEAYVEALPLTVIHVPNRKADGTGLSTEIDHFRPWLMWAGTPLAHIMVPGH